MSEHWSEDEFNLVLRDLRAVWTTTSEENQRCLDRLITWYVLRRNKTFPRAVPVSSVAQKERT